MGAALPPGIGNAQQAQQATAFMRAQPWYQQLVSSWGLNPAGDANGNPGRLSDAQQQQLLSTAQQHGIGISDSYQIDPNGQIAQKPSHLLRNIGLGVGAGALALTGIGAAGIGPLAGLFGGAAGAGSAAAGAGGLAADGTLASSTIGSGFIPAIAGGTGSAVGAGAGGAGILGTAAKFAGISDPSNPLSYLGVAGKIGDALGAAGQGAANGRVTQAGITQREDQLAQQQYQNQLAGAKFALAAPQERASNSVKGDILSNAKDFAWGAPTMSGNIPIPTSTGGLRPSIFSDNTRALGAQMSSDALAGAKSGADNLPVPALTPLPEAGTGSSILTTAGIIGGLADAFNPALSKLQSAIPLKKPQPPVNYAY